VNGELRTPTKIPQKVQMIKEDEAPPGDGSSGVVGGVPGGIPGGQMGGVIGGIISSTPVAVPKVATPRVSGFHRAYRRAADPEGQPHLSTAGAPGPHSGPGGDLQAQISKDGSIENLQLISGHPMLAPAAIEAVKQWKYKPYLLNGEPVEVDTQVQVNFTLAGG
jgi:periplasmic protein TonB